MVIKKVKTLPEFFHLMRKLEQEMPNLRWVEGQKPSGWAPSSFPREIYIEDGQLYCQRCFI